MSQDKLCSIVMLSYNQADFTKNCLESIRRNVTCPIEVIMIDNNSSQETVEYLRQQKDIVLVENKENKGFARGCNQGMAMAKGEYILLLNNDTIVPKHSIENMIEFMETNKEAAMVGPITNNTIGKQKIKVDIPYENVEEIESFAETITQSGKAAERTVRLIGFCMLFRREFMDEIGVFDGGFAIGNYEDDDLCIRTLLANKKMYICNNSFIYHYLQASFTRNKMPVEDIKVKNKLYLENKWDDINWNHHAVTNQEMISYITGQEPKAVLHLCAGLGSVGLEIKNKYPDCYLVGAEYHEVRRKIATEFFDELYEWDDNLAFLSNTKKEKFDIIILEGALELAGPSVLEKVKKYFTSNTKIILRVFNKNHISTIQKIVIGSTWGRTISAVNDEFKYFYDIEFTKELEEKYGFTLEKCVEVKKSFKQVEQELYDKLSDYAKISEEGNVYNRVYYLAYEQ